MKKRIISVITLLSIMCVLIIGNLEKENAEIKEVRIIEEDIPYEKEIVEQIDPIELCISNMQSEMNAIENIEDKEIWFCEYKKIIDKYGDIIGRPDTIYDYFSDDELKLLFGVVQAEIGDEYTFDQKANVANVIFNRLSDEEFGDTMHQVLNPNQFCSVREGRHISAKVSETTILACEYAFEIEDTTNGCVAFRSGNIPKKWCNWKLQFVDEAGHGFYK